MSMSTVLNQCATTNLDNASKKLVESYLSLDDYVILNDIEKIERFYTDEYDPMLREYGFSIRLFKIAIHHGRLLIADYIHNMCKNEVDDCFYDLTFDYATMVEYDYIDSLLYILRRANNKQAFLELVFNTALTKKNENVILWTKDACKFYDIDYLSLVKSLIRPNCWRANAGHIVYVCKTSDKHSKIASSCIQWLLEISLVDTKLLIINILNLDSAVFSIVLYDAIKTNDFRMCRWLYENRKYYVYNKHRCPDRTDNTIWLRVKGILSGKKSFFRDGSQEQAGFLYMF